MSESFDYIVVGAGSAGCVLANRLSAGAKVLLLEAGEDDTGEHIRQPAQLFHALFDPGICRPYVTEAQPGLGGRPVAVHRGVVRGGCSSINGMIYVRGNRSDYDAWAEAGNAGWGYDDVLPLFKRSERFAGGPTDHHGVDGSLDVRWMPDPSDAVQAFVEAGASLERFRDSSTEWDFNGERQEDAVGLYQVNVTPEGRRASAASAFLDPALDRDGPVVRTGAAVMRVVIEDGRAVGVEYGREGERHVARTDGEVIVCAGAFESPKLLMLSGIGPPGHLREHGIEPVVDLPGVGRNLHDHLMTLLYSLAKGRPGSSGYLAEAGLFTNSKGSGPPDLQYHLLAGLPGLPVDPTATPNIVLGPTLLQPRSRGTVRLRGPDPADPPVVDPRYLAHDEDVEVLVRGVELARELLRTPALADLADGGGLFAVPDPTQPGERMVVPPQGREGLDDLVRATATTVWHPVGTCKMGSDEGAVVDSALRVRGVSGLRVADASVMPRITSGNTNAPTIMIGEKAADLILG